MHSKLILQAVIAVYLVTVFFTITKVSSVIFKLLIVLPKFLYSFHKHSGSKLSLLEYYIIEFNYPRLKHCIDRVVLNVCYNLYAFVVVDNVTRG